MSKESSTWHSPRLDREIKLVRWGEVGTPVLLFPTAGGDAEEIERFLMVRALSDLLEAQRIKVYSCDSVAGQAWLDGDRDGPDTAAHVQHLFDACIYREVVPAIRQDCGSPDIEIVTAGASIGAFNALAALCRHPDVFRLAICMSGTYDLTKLFQSRLSRVHHEASPLHFVPELPDGEHLQQLRRRFVLLTHGEGRWEDPAQSWRAADVLGKRGIPNRVDAWDREWDHDWQTWREMLPKYLDELLD